MMVLILAGVILKPPTISDLRDIFSASSARYALPLASMLWLFFIALMVVTFAQHG